MRAWLIVALLATGCVADRASNPAFGCMANADCEAGEICDRGFCVGGGMDAAVPDAGACAAERQCYDGPSGTEGVGVCRGGCLVGTDGEPRCEGQIQPSNELCNSADDDCDGRIDEDFALDSVEQCGACDAQCAMGETCCAGREGGHECANLAGNADHCGACGEPCASGEACCGDAGCIDVSSDDANCGACGNACAAGLTCCDGACVNIRSSSEHCGGCGNPACEGETTCCPSDLDATPACRPPGDCATCTDCDGAGELCCGGECITDSDTNPAHCGGCGIACTADQRCCGGSCVDLDAACTSCDDDCGSTGQCCGACVPITSDSNCGGCGVSCTAGQTCCGEAGCVDTTINNSHCGGCDMPCGTDVCSNGNCCAPGTTWCDGECISLTTNAHCGGCGTRCTGLTACKACADGTYRCALLGVAC